MLCALEQGSDDIRSLAVHGLDAVGFVSKDNSELLLV